jgi:RNA polymerase sigma-70 factor (ECF subfamily)
MPEDLAEIYRTTYRALVRFLYRKVWDTDRAEDLAQEAFARALVHKPENARGWLFVVAANMARDEARKAERDRRHLTLLKGEMPDAAPAPDAAVIAAMEREHVRGALEQLTPRDREVLLLWDAGRSYDEIADHTGLAKSAIGTTLARARQRLVAAYEAGSEGEHVARR